MYIAVKFRLGLSIILWSAFWFEGASTECRGRRGVVQRMPFYIIIIIIIIEIY